MLKSCKYSKFQEVNFKILACILLTPKILALLKPPVGTGVCFWCGDSGTLEHILLDCKFVQVARHSFVSDNTKILPKWKQKYWVLGTHSDTVNQMIWVVNFAIYKAMLHASSGIVEDLYQLIKSECAWYVSLFPILGEIS